MVHVTVLFHANHQRWEHVFELQEGATVRELKGTMLKNRGTDEEVDSFELRRLNRRVPDTEVIQHEQTLDFEFLGADDGAKKKRREVDDVRAWEKQQAREAAARESRPKPEPAAEAPKAAKTSATAAPLGFGDHQITIWIEKSLDMKTAVTVSMGATVMKVKEELAGQDPTGAMKVSEFGLGVMSGDDKGPPLPGSTLLTREHLELALTDPDEEAEFPVPQPAPRPKAPPTEPKGPRWEVVGGGDKGGILVREGMDTKSAQLPERLATGALVEELELEGERLHYKKLSGAGPAEGWVSVMLQGRDLLTSKPYSMEELFTLDKALSIQEELMAGFAKVEFQRALANLIKEYPEKKGLKFIKARTELFLTVQSVVLPRYGFEGSQTGVMHMMRAFGPHQSQEVAWNNGQLNMLLQI